MYVCMYNIDAIHSCDCMYVCSREPCMYLYPMVWYIHMVLTAIQVYCDEFISWSDFLGYKGRT